MVAIDIAEYIPASPGADSTVIVIVNLITINGRHWDKGSELTLTSGRTEVSQQVSFLILSRLVTPCRTVARSRQTGREFSEFLQTRV